MCVCVFRRLQAKGETASKEAKARAAAAGGKKGKKVRAGDWVE